MAISRTQADLDSLKEKVFELLIFMKTNITDSDYTALLRVNLFYYIQTMRSDVHYYNMR